MSSRHSTKREDEMSQTKERILRSAAAIFSEKGYKGASIRLISSMANVNVAAVNYYFGSKEKLYFNTYRYVLELAENCSPWSKVVLPEYEGLDAWCRYAREFFTLIMRRILRKDKRSMWRRKMFGMELINPSACSELLLNRYYVPLYDFLYRLLGQVLEGEDDGIKVTWTQAVMQHLVCAGMMMPPWDDMVWYRGKTPEDWIDGMLDFLMEMLKSRLLVMRAQKATIENQGESDV